ncbi:MFS transporter [Amycolatopsis sp. NPDC049159]|uniref:MFS transporter n=1 Tax=unclassified Amycolatopsis TaxID=2618356 RepID=UPI0033DB301A
MSSARGNVPLYLVLAMVCADMLAAGSALPVLPEVIRTLTGGDSGAAAIHLALMIAVMNALQFVAAPALGALSDRLGRRPMVLLVLGCSMLNNALIAFVPSLGVLYLTQVITGLAVAKVAVISAYIADISGPEQRIRNFGLLGLCMNGGFVLGSATGGLLGAVSLHLPYLVAAALQAVNLIFALTSLPESHPPEKRRPVRLPQLYPWRALAVLRSTPAMSRVSALVLCYCFATLTFQSMWVFYSGKRFGWGPLQNGILLAVLSACMGLAQSKLVPVMVARLGERRAMLAGLASAAVALGGLAFVGSPWIVVPFVLCYTVGCVITPASRAAAAREVAAEEQGRVQGALAGLNSLDALVAPLIGSALFDYFTGPEAVVAFPGAPFLLCGLILLFAMRIVRRKRWPAGTRDEVGVR